MMAKEIFEAGEISTMLVEISTNKPRSFKGPAAEALYKQLENEIAEIRARGLEVDVPSEIPDLD